jgi:hypothetical protein
MIDPVVVPVKHGSMSPGQTAESPFAQADQGRGSVSIQRGFVVEIRISHGLVGGTFEVGENRIMIRVARRKNRATEIGPFPFDARPVQPPRPAQGCLQSRPGRFAAVAQTRNQANARHDHSWKRFTVCHIFETIFH